MQVQRRPFLNTFVYLCLFAGAVLFAFPFVWMVSSSVKVDRELFQKGIVILPDTPHAPAHSPYVDLAYYKEPLSPEVAARLPLIERVARASGYAFPATVNPDEAARGVAQGLARKLEMVLPPATWQRDEAALEAEIRRVATPETIGELFDTVYRQMAIGQVRARAWGQPSDQELGAGQPMADQLRNATPGVLKVTGGNDRGLPCALLDYDFSKGDHWWLNSEFTTNFDVRDLHRLRLQLRMDDTWHRFQFTVEKLGVLYRAERPFYPGNTGWVTLTYQEPGPEDQMTRMKAWIHLKEVARGPQYLNDPHRLRLGFEMSQSTPLAAWWGKLINNYSSTMAQIPVTRYLMTSLYLVILNIILIIFSSSVVAYAIARLRWPGRDWYFILMLATMMIPPQVTMIPGFLIWKHLGAYNTLVPLWLGAAFASPFYVFLLRQFLKGVPKDLEDAAVIDGCGYFQIYWYLMLPLMKPTLAVIAVWTFMGTWNNFMGPLIFVADQRLYPLSYGLYAYSVQVGNNPSLTLAGAFIMTLPVVFIFFFCQRYFIEGVTLTGIKG